jgi:hypothetical protein
LLQRSGHPIELTTLLVIKKGQVVPAQLRQLPHLKVNAKGVALADWEDGWCQSHWDKTTPWSDAWGECWDNSKMPSSLPGGLYQTSVTHRRFSFDEFSKAERTALARYGIHS